MFDFQKSCFENNVISLTVTFRCLQMHLCPYKYNWSFYDSLNHILLSPHFVTLLIYLFSYIPMQQLSTDFIG